MNKKETISTIIGWVALIAGCYMLYHFGVLKIVAYIIGGMFYIGIGCLVSAFAGDEPKQWLEKHPIWMFTFHIAIVVLWLPILMIIVMWDIFVYSLKLVNINLKKI